MAGLTAEGFEAKPLEDIVSDLEAEERAEIDPALDTSAESVFGQLNAIVGTKLRELWELGEAVYSARRRGNASGAALRDLAALTGTEPAEATKGTVTLRLTVAAGRTIPAGAVAHVAGDADNRWVTTEAAVNAGGSPATVDVDAEAEEAGAVPAYAGTITSIATPHAGWSAVTNLADATPGRDAETDAALRLRAEREVQGAGAGTVGNLRAALSALEGVTQAVVFENDTDTADADGIPPHAVECLVLGGDTQDILDAVWAHKPCGIKAHGSTSGTVTDATGVTRAVAFTRPTAVNVHVALLLGTDPATYAGDDAVKEALVGWGDALLAGDPVRLAKVIDVVMGVAGVVDVVATAGRASTALYPLNLAMALRERADLDSARVYITTVSA